MTMNAPTNDVDDKSAGDAPPSALSEGVFPEIGELPDGAILTEDALARIFRRHPVSIKRAVERGELPPPTRLLGGPVWTAAAILNHINGRLDMAKKDKTKIARKVDDLRP